MSEERMIVRECSICGEMFDAYERQEFCPSCDRKLDEAFENPKFKEDLEL